MKKNTSSYILAAAGLALLILGLYMTKTGSNLNEVIPALPYVCIGIGCGLFGHGMGNIVSQKAIKSNPVIQKQIEIEKNDERNITITNRSKAKAYDMMTFIFGALMLSFALMNIDMTAVLLLVSAYLFVHGYGIYYRYKYGKEM